MKIYDSKFQNEITELDFGNVNVGESKTIEFYIYNENPSIASIEIKADRVTLSTAKLEVRFKEKFLIKAVWTPSLSLKQSLKSKIEISGGEIYV